MFQKYLFPTELGANIASVPLLIQDVNISNTTVIQIVVALILRLGFYFIEQYFKHKKQK